MPALAVAADEQNIRHVDAGAPDAGHDRQR
jgi:hypothetical protein